MKFIFVALLCGLLLGCGTSPTAAPVQPLPASVPASAKAPTATPSQGPATSPPLSAEQLAPSPPPSVIEDLAAGTRMEFTPLSAAQLSQVQIPVTIAKQTALAIGPQGYGTQGGKGEWKRVGCVYLGWYKAPMMPSYGYVPPTFPAYLVQILGDPVKGWPGVNVEVVVINAQTGERDTIYGSGPGPIMGTTCGVPA